MLIKSEAQRKRELCATITDAIRNGSCCTQTPPNGLRGCDTPNLYDKVMKNGMLVSQDQRNHKVSTMIHLQVHLQIPCYDFYPVQAIAIELFPAIPRPEGLDTAVRSPLETAQSRTATGGVYKWQGRNQRELMTHTY